MIRVSSILSETVIDDLWDSCAAHGFKHLVERPAADEVEVMLQRCCLQSHQPDFSNRCDDFSEIMKELKLDFDVNTNDS